MKLCIYSIICSFYFRGMKRKLLPIWSEHHRGCVIVIHEDLHKHTGMFQMFTSHITIPNSDIRSIVELCTLCFKCCWQLERGREGKREHVFCVVIVNLSAVVICNTHTNKTSTTKLNLTIYSDNYEMSPYHLRCMIPIWKASINSEAFIFKITELNEYNKFTKSNNMPNMTT
jgi:hypothetical protein